MKTAALYVRVSTTKQEAENQLLELHEFCSKSNWVVFKEYVDIISGSEDSRPAFDEMFREAHQKKFNIVLFWALDRFSRSGTRFTINKLSELESLDVAWKSYSELYFDSVGQFKDVVLSIMATLAKLEREKISERTKLGLKRARKEGKKLGRPKISNYHKRKIKELYEKYGSMNQVAKELEVSYGSVFNVIKKGL
ncbi:recombinase family protein [Candidatus Woesearchaeota archaeon]|nr:recombinase family protein [Candidatus Woesearchaeota archaeon]